ncbi:MAG: NADP-dependent malic enzyme [Candidatus Bathyarchaeia archaeon]
MRRKEALRWHSFYRGKLQVCPKVPIRSWRDFAVWYTPGVAEPCREIREDGLKVYEYTNKWNSVAVVTDGSRVLGLGDIGPEASLPVMEGKAIIFKYLGGVDAYPICLNAKKVEEIVQAVEWIKPSFGGINLEDISSPKCFEILEKLRRRLDIPVWHDDQQGTATVVLAALINALKLVGKNMSEAHVSLIGAGAANTAIYRILTAAGVKRGNVIMVDSKGILNNQRFDLKETSPLKWKICLESNEEGRMGGVEEALRDADVCVACSQPKPGLITENMVRSMADNSIVFALANPEPEIWPWEAKKAGAKVVATGRSDFPNAVNNSLGFPGIFRGALDVRARTITDEMCVAASYAIAETAEENGLKEDYIIPSMDEWEVYPREAVAVGLKAMEQGIARLKLTRKSLAESVQSIIEESRRLLEMLMKSNLIPTTP